MLVGVTGAAGFIGTATVLELIGAGHKVRAIDGLTDYYATERKLQNFDITNLPGVDQHIELITADNAERLFDGVDAILHLAAQPGVRLSWERFQPYLQHNIECTHAVLSAADKLGIDRVVYASSSSVYGHGTGQPTPESAPLAPVSAYGASKASGELLCQAAAARGMSTIMLRYFTAIGPRQRPDMALARLIDAAHGVGSFTVYGDGTQRRDFTFVEDVARANRLAVETPTVNRGDAVPINIAGGISITLNELIRMVAEITGGLIVLDNAPLPSGDVRVTEAICDRAVDMLGWKPTVRLREAVSSHVAWWRGSPVAATA